MTKRTLFFCNCFRDSCYNLHMIEQNVTEQISSSDTENKPLEEPKCDEMVRRAIRSPFLLIRRNYQALISFELRYKVFVMLIVFPLLSYSERLLLVVNQESNIAMYNVVDMLKNPLSWGVLLFMGILMSIFTAVEQIGILRILNASVFNIKADAKQTFADTANIIIEQCKWKNLTILPYFLIVFPIAQAFDTSSVTRFIRIPGFILEHFQKYPVFQYGYIAACLILTLLSMRIIYSMTIMTVEGDDFPTACRKSLKLTTLKRIPSLLLAMIKTVLLYGTLVVIFSILVLALIFGVIHWLEPAYDLMNLVTTEFIMIYTLAVGTIASWIFISFFQSVVMSNYYGYCFKENGAVPPLRKCRTMFNRRAAHAVFAVVCMVVLYFSVPSRYRQFKAILSGNTAGVMVMAHRGYSNAAPENTMPAFEKAYEIGVNSIELDVQMTKDGEIIVMHDDNLKRTTGVDKNVWEVTYDEIKDLDNGSFFSKEYAGTKIPTLEEAIRFCKGRMYINIEIKRNGHDEGIEDRVVEIIRANDFQSECDITSQDYDTLKSVREKYPDIMLAYTSVIGIGDVQNLDACDILSIQETFATFDTVEALHRQGKRVFVWTVNEQETMERLIGLNVDAILTNDPQLALDTIKNHQGFADFYYRLSQILIYLQ